MEKAWLFCSSLLDQIFQGTSYNDSVAKVWSLVHPQISLQPEGTIVKSLVAVELSIFPPGEESLTVLYMETVSSCFSWVRGPWARLCPKSGLLLVLRDHNGREPFGMGVVAKPWEVEKVYQLLLTLPPLSSIFGAGNDNGDCIGSRPLLDQPVTGVQAAESSDEPLLICIGHSETPSDMKYFRREWRHHWNVSILKSPCSEILAPAPT